MDELDKQAAEQAPPVNAFMPDPTDILEDIHKTVDQKTQLREAEERILMEGVDSEFWRIIKKKLTLRIHNLRSASSLRLGKGNLNFQEIGVRAVIINEIADGLQEIINLIEFPYKKRKLEVEGGEDSESSTTPS